jgi:hypothetical protein
MLFLKKIMDTLVSLGEGALKPIVSVGAVAAA